MRTLLIVISIVCAWTAGALTRAKAETAGVHAPNSLEQASQTWQILDYLADDYRGAVADGRIKRGDLLLLEAMGGGFTWGAALLRW